MGVFNFLFNKKNNKIDDFVNREAIIIDVRSDSEYKSGAIVNSINIPIQNLSGKIQNIKDYKKPIITCCASGVRSGTASAILKTHNIEAINGGSWMSLTKKL